MQYPQHPVSESHMCSGVAVPGEVQIHPNVTSNSPALKILLQHKGEVISLSVNL